MDYNSESYKKYYQSNREKIIEKTKKWYNRVKDTEEYKKKKLERKREYYDSINGRASYLSSCYNQMDKKRNFKKGDLTTQWIVDNILTKSCVHCGCSDWHKLGCNRLDNSKPHTKDNVEPCCFECNCELNNPKKKVVQYTLDGKVVKIWESMADCEKEGYNHSAISKCCKNEYNKNGNIYKRYIWSYVSD